MRFKIRTKIILSFFAPIILLTVIVVIVSGYLLINLYNEAQRLNSISKESIKVADLSLSLNRVLMPVNDYIITGNKKYIEDFKAISIDVERGLKEAEEILPLIEEIEEFDGEVKVERDILKGVKDSWQNIREISLRILAIPDPVGNKDAMRLMEELDYKWGYPAIESLKRWREIDLNEYKEILEKHNRAWRQAWITMIVSVVSYLVIFFVYILFYSRIAARNDEELQASEKRFRSLAEHLPNMVFINKKGGRVVYANKKCEEVMKYKREEFYSPDFNFLSLIAPEYIDMIKIKFYNHMKGEDVEPYEYAVITKDGKRLEVIFNAVLMDYEGERAILGILTDITERKRLEEDIHRSLRRLSTLYNIDRSVAQSLELDEILKNGLSMTLKILEIEGGAIFLIDPDGKTMTVRTHKGLSEEFVNNVRQINIDEGISGRAVTEKKPVILNISEYPTERLAPFIKKEGFKTLASTPIISAGRVFGALTLETFKIKALPQEETELLTSIGIQLGTAVHNASLFQSVQNEILECNRAEESLRKATAALQRSETLQRAILSTIPDMMFRLSRDGIFLDFKPAKGFEPYLPPEQFLGKRLSDVLPEEVAIPAIDYIDKAFQTKEEQAFEYKLPIKGEILDFEARFAVITEKEILVLIRDITKRKRLEQEIIRQDKLATMGHLMSGVAHEIKNPLNIISGNVQILNMEEHDAEKKKIYEIVLQQINRSVKIIDNLLGFARRKEYEIKDININNLIESTIRLVEYEMKLENIIFIKDFENDLPVIKGDVDQLAQVFLNLINNARDSMNEKQKRIRSGELKIEGWKGEVRITTKKADDMVEINFTDTGLGIPEDKVANVFKPFFTTKAEGKGTGLGLSIARDIIGKHGGKVELENMAGEGVRFIIRLPM